MPYILSKWGNKLLTAIVAEWGGVGGEGNPLSTGYFKKEEKTHKEKNLALKIFIL